MGGQTSMPGRTGEGDRQVCTTTWCASATWRRPGDEPRRQIVRGASQEREEILLGRQSAAPEERHHARALISGNLPLLAANVINEQAA
jgi:hypothetical protein